jgi:hypothetical protein
MNRSPFRNHVLFTVMLAACAEPSAEQECAMDAQCPSENVCDAGSCVPASELEDDSGPAPADGAPETGGVEGDGPMPSCERYPDPVAIAALQEGLGEAPEPQLSATFLGLGALGTLGGTTCAPTTSDTDPATLGTNWLTCMESYDCGGCEVWAGHYEGDPDFDESWWLVARDPDPDCNRFEAFYRLLEADVVATGGGVLDGEVEGDDGVGDACSACLESCSGLSSCCTGTGCACEGACQPTECLAGLAHCCGIGSCVCTDNCPY